MTNWVTLGTVDILAITGGFLQEVKNFYPDAVLLKAFWENFCRILLDGENYHAQRIAYYQPENAQAASLLLHHRFVLVPAEHEDLRRAIDLMAGHSVVSMVTRNEEKDSPKTLVLSCGSEDFVPLLKSLQHCRLVVLALGEKPEEMTRFPIEWIDLTKAPWCVSEGSTPESRFESDENESGKEENAQTFSGNGIQPSDEMETAVPETSGPSIPEIGNDSRKLSEKKEAEESAKCPDPESFAKTDEPEKSEDLESINGENDSAELKTRMSSEEVAARLTFGQGRTAVKLPKKKVTRKCRIDDQEKAVRQKAENLARELEQCLDECQSRRENLLASNEEPRKFWHVPFLRDTLTLEECENAFQAFRVLKNAFLWFAKHLVWGPNHKERESIRICTQNAALVLAIFRNFEKSFQPHTTLWDCRNFLLDDMFQILGEKVQFLREHESIPAPGKLIKAEIAVENLNLKCSARQALIQARGELLESVQKLKEAALNEFPSQVLLDDVLLKMRRLCSGHGEKTNSAFVRNLFEPIIDLFPEENSSEEGRWLPEEFYQVRQSVDLFRIEHGKTAEENGSNGAEHEEDPNILKVRGFLAGKKFCIVGGLPTPHLQERLQNAFGASASWRTSSHNESNSKYSALIQDKNVLLFIIFVKWASHKHCEELARQAMAQGKKVVRLHMETNPGTIAGKIVEQCFHEK